MTALLALGDSLTCGEGVGVRVPRERTWTALLAEALPGVVHLPLAAPGATVGQVLRTQLPQVRQASVATLLVGLNDVARPGFVADAVGEDLLRLVDGLCARSDVVVLGRLHDPLRLLWVPARLRRLGRERLAVVNAAVDEAARRARVRVLDLDQVQPLRRRAAWAVDRVHPSAAGHAAMAQAAADLLRPALPTTGRVPVPELPPEPTRAAHTRWLLAHGMPYATARLIAAARPDRSGP